MKMKNLFLMFIALFFAFGLFAQEEEQPKYTMVEHVYLDVKAGSQDDFEKAVKAHNDAHHKGAHKASLYNISTGADAGTYVWAMGPLTYTDLDSRPSDEAHDADWDNNVGQHVAGVGGVDYWKLNEKLSVMDDAPNEDDKFMVWMIDVKGDEWYRFNAFMEKVKVINEKMGDELWVWNRRLNDGDGKDVAVVWSFGKWADLDEDDWSMSKEFDAEYGSGSWSNALREWSASTNKVSRTVWTRVN